LFAISADMSKDSAGFEQKDNALRPPPGQAEWLDGDLLDLESLEDAFRRCRERWRRQARTQPVKGPKKP
jgi:hypothetical protein